MEVFLLKEMHPIGTGFSIRPVPYRAPDEKTQPSTIESNAQSMAWLQQYGSPEFNPFFGQKGSVQLMANSLGYWPPPFNAEVIFLKDFVFNDELTF